MAKHQSRQPPPHRQVATEPAQKDERLLLAERLRKARVYAGLSQEEVAEKVGVPRTALVNIESGQRRVDAVELKRLAELYQRPVGYFTGEVAVGAALPEDIAHLARRAAKLTENDRRELSRFAEFLASKSGRSSGEEAAKSRE